MRLKPSAALVLGVGLMLASSSCGRLSASSSAMACAGSWTIEDQSLSGTSLRAISAVNSTDIWAVGDTPTIHWDGLSWSVVPGGPAGNGVDALSANDVWVVGSGIEHWDGTSWTGYPVPTPPGATSLELNAVSMASTSDGLVVGRYFVGAAFHGYAAHWNGTSWALALPPPSRKQAIVLHDVVSVSPTAAWAVGTRFTGTAENLIEYWNGESWLPLVAPAGSNNSLFAITAVSSKELFDAGGVNQGGPFVYRWRSGAGWRFQYPGGPSTPFTGISADTAKDAWAVGSGTDYGHESQVAVSDHWDGHSWAPVPVADPGAGGGLAAVASLPGEAWAVGWQRAIPPGIDHPLIEHYC